MQERMSYFKRTCKKPSKNDLQNVIGWYGTRLVAVLLWCGVVWAIVGKEALPASLTDDKESTSACLPELRLDNNSFSELLADLMLSSDSDYTFSNYSYVYICDETDYRYCLVTFSFDSTCASKLSFNVILIDNLTVPDNHSSFENYSFLYDISKAIGDERIGNTHPQSLFDIPDGHFFALIVLVVVSSIGGFLAKLLKLPPLLGMMMAGFLLRNIPVIGIAGDISSVWSSTLRNIALVIILIRGGISLDAKELWKLKFAVPTLAILPCILEGATDGLIAIYFLEMPWQWGLMLGYLLAALSPSVVVPTTLSLREKVVGINQGITSLIVAAANIDVVIAISLFSLFLGLIFSDGSLFLDIFRAPIELSIGIVYGVLFGLLLWLLPTKHHTSNSIVRNRFFLLFGFGLLSLLGAQNIRIGGASLAGAGALGVLCVSFVGVQKWILDEKNMVSRVFYLLWQFAQPVLFGLIGAALNIRDISGSLVGKALLLISVGLTVRLTTAVLAVTGHKFTVKEKVFVAFSWLPKATVQAAISSIALDLARQQGDSTQIDLGMMVVTVAVLAIVFTAPLGATLMGVIGPWLLAHPEKKPTDEKIEEDDTNDNFLNGIVPQNDTRETVHSEEMNSSISNYKESTV